MVIKKEKVKRTTEYIASEMVRRASKESVSGRKKMCMESAGDAEILNRIVEAKSLILAGLGARTPTWPAYQTSKCSKIINQNNKLFIKIHSILLT